MTRALRAARSLRSPGFSDPPDPVGPLRATLIEDARRRSRALTEAAGTEARETVAKAREEADRILAGARADGEAAAETAAARDLARVRTDARALVLDAQRHAYEDVRQGALDELARRHDSAEVADLARRLGTLARDRLGEGGVEGGLDGHREPGELAVVESGRLRAVVRLEALVDRALAEMAEEIGELWR